MLIYLWNFCKCALLKITALLWNACKLVHGEQQHKLNNPAKGEQQQQLKSKVSMAVEVWTDVLGFVKRDKLATISLTNWQINQICWPRLHGNRVMAHEVEWMIIARQELGSPTAIMKHRDGTEVPFADCLPPDYITGFYFIEINFLNDQVLAFIKVIAPVLTKTGVSLDFSTNVKNLNEQQRGFVYQLVKIFREDLICIYTEMANIPFLPDMDNQKSQLYLLHVDADTDIPLLMKMLATPRLDGQQRVIDLFVETWKLVMKMLDAIIEDFRDSIQPLPQPFYIKCASPDKFNIQRSEEENARTDETLTILPDVRSRQDMEIYRHPKGEHGKWAEDAQQREQTVDNYGRATPIDLYHPYGR